MIYGSRVSLLVGITTVALSLTIGLVARLLGRLFRRLDRSSRSCAWSIFCSPFPGILLAIAFTAVLGPGLDHVILALCLIGWTGYARLVRGEILALRERDFVQAARALGCRPERIILRHLLPNLLPPLLIQATFGLAAAIVAEGSLSFLGLGVEPPTPSWGSMLNDGRQFLLVAPHLTTYPGLGTHDHRARAQSCRRRAPGSVQHAKPLIGSNGSEPFQTFKPFLGTEYIPEPLELLNA